MAGSSLVGTFVLLFYVLLALLAPHDSSPSREEQIDTFVRSTFPCRNVRGISLSIVKDGRVMMSRGYGVKDTTKREPVTKNTLFQIASLTKAFTATMLVSLMQDNNTYTGVHKLSVKTKLADVLPEFSIGSSKLRTDYTTIEDIMAHRMGMPENKYIRLNPNVTRSNLHQYLRHFRARGTFRSSFYYSSLFYGVASGLVEQLGADTYEHLVERELFRPLDMESSSFATTADYDGGLDIAKPQIVINGKELPISWNFVRQWAQMIGSGGIISNAEDMAKWMLFHLNEGRNARGEQVIAENILQQTYSNKLTIRSSTLSKYFTKPRIPATTSNDAYGMGWKLGYYRGYKILTHTGTTFGYNGLMTLIPDMKLGIYTMLTGYDASYIYRTILHNYIADIYMDQDPWINATRACTYPTETPMKTRRSAKSRQFRKMKRSATRPLSAYTGTYHNPGYGFIHVRLTNSLQLSLNYGVANFRLHSTAASDRFSGEGTGIVNFLHINYFQFSSPNGDDSVINKLTVPGFEKYYPPVFTKATSTGPETIVG